MRLKVLNLLGAVAPILAGSAAHAAVPVDGAIGMQPPATDLAKEVVDFHTLLLLIISAIVVFVTLLLIWVMVRYNRRANPVPRTFSHNTPIEIAWTVIPVFILAAIAVVSFPLLFKQENVPAVDESEIVDVKVYGRQWYWSYIYGSGDDEIYFDSNMIQDADLGPGQIAKLSVNNPMVVPVDKYIRLSITASDVIHAWAIPGFALKVDAIPGRLNQIWFKANEPGVYYGQCSELCGVNHAYMPIEVRVLPQEQYETWLERVAESTGAGNEYLQSVQPLASQVASAD